MLRRSLTWMLLPRLAAGTLPGWLARPLHEAVRTDGELGRAYDALRRAERAAAAPAAAPAAVTAAQRDLLEALVLGGPTAAPARARRFALPGAAAALAAAAVVGFVVLRPAGDDGGDRAFPLGDLAARSERLHAEPLGVKVSCVRTVDGENQVVGSATAGARQSGDVLSCPHGSLLAFSTTNLGAETRHMFVVGVGEDGARRWYAPFDRDAAATAVPAGQVDAVLPTLADTSSMPADARLSLFILISDEPFDAAAVERQLASSALRGVPLSRLERLPLMDVPLQGRIDVVSPPRAD
jgi:hypothetical protein